MDADPSRVGEMGVKSATLLKELHKIEVNDNSFPNRKDELLEWAEKIKPYLDPSEIDEIVAFINAIPETNTFLHGDFNSKNVMVQDGEFILIDIGDAAVGHPVFDVAGLILAYIYLQHSVVIPDDEKYRLMGFHLEDAPKMLGAMFSTYFGISTQEEIQKKVSMIMPYANIMAAYHGSRRANYNPEYIPGLIERMVKPKVLPSIREAVPLDW